MKGAGKIDGGGIWNAPLPVICDRGLLGGKRLIPCALLEGVSAGIVLRHGAASEGVAGRHGSFADANSLTRPLGMRAQNSSKRCA